MSFWLSFEPGLGGALAAAACALLLAWSWRSPQPRLLRALRATVLLLLLLLALKPSLDFRRSRSVKPRLTIIVDSGLSMGAKDGTAQTRLQRACAWLLRHRREIESRSEPTLLAGSDRFRRVEWEELGRLVPSASSFDFPAAAREAAELKPPSRVWLLSDGVSDSDLQAGLEAWRGPVDALGVGPRKIPRSVSLAELKTPDFVFLHSRFPVSISVEASDLKGGELSVKLLKGGSVLAESRQSLRSDFEVATATLTVEAASLGQERFRLEIVGRPAAGTAVVSRREFAVEVIRQKYRIMYLAGRPSFEYAHLREQLKSDPNHELVSFVILRNPENATPVPDQELSLIPFPAQEIFVQNLMQFDLFILENFAYWRFNLPVDYLQGLKRFVSQGGGLLVIGGSNAFTQGGYKGTPLEEVLPVGLWESQQDYVASLFKPKVAAPQNPLIKTEASVEASLKLWEALPPLDGYNRFASVKPQTSVLLAHPSEKTASGAPLPIVAVREFGKGKVMVMGSDSSWRWKLGSGMDWSISSFYARFWSRAVQYLTGSLDLKKVKFSPLPDRLAPKEPLQLSLRVFDENFRPLSGSDLDLRLNWTSPDGKSKSVFAREQGPGIFAVELTGLSEGGHALRAVARHRGQHWGEDQLRFFWQPRPPEQPLNRRWLGQLAVRTEGQYAELDGLEPGRWLALLPSVRSESQLLDRRSLWDRPFWLWAILGLLLTEWFLRRRKGYA